MSKIETIEEKTYRLMLAAALVTDPGISFEEAIEHEEFKLNCRLVELAIAEEREACKSITLTGEEIHDLAEAVGLAIQPQDYTDIFEDEMTITACPSVGVLNDDGNKIHSKHIAYLSDYPDEGTFMLSPVPAAPKDEVNQ